MADRTIAAARERIGESLGVSDWLPIDQAKLDAHARVTGDEAWLHNDPERCSRESPFGKPIAQGSLLVSMLFSCINTMAPLGSDVAYGLNYGFDRVRFIRPVLVDSRVRVRMTIKDVRPKGRDRWVVTIGVTLEVEGSAEPHMSADWLVFVVQK